MDDVTTENVEILRDDPKKALLKIAIPLMISLVIMSFYNIIDRIWVAGLGSEPLAAVGFVTPLFMILVGLGNGLGAGANSLISRYIGAKNYEKASNSALHGILLVTIISIVIPIILMPFLKDILTLMGASEVMGYAMGYGSIVIIGSIALLLNSLFASELRAEGDMKKSTFIMISGGIINIILDPIFIYTLNLGVEGAAIATVLSSAIPILFGIYWLFIKKDTYLNYNIKGFNYENSITKDILLVGLPASVEQLVMSISNIILNSMITAVAGTMMIAAFTSSFSVLQIAIMPAVGVATAAITIAGVAYGAKDYDKLNIICNYSIKIGLLISLIIVILLYIFAPQVSYLFAYSASGEQLRQLITDVLRIVCLATLGIPIGATCASIFQGMGKGTFSLILTTIRELLLVLVFAYILTFVFNLGFHGIIWGLVFGIIIGGFIALMLYKGYIKRMERMHNM